MRQHLLICNPLLIFSLCSSPRTGWFRSPTVGSSPSHRQYCPRIKQKKIRLAFLTLCCSLPLPGSVFPTSPVSPASTVSPASQVTHVSPTSPASFVIFLSSTLYPLRLDFFCSCMTVLSPDTPRLSLLCLAAFSLISPTVTLEDYGCCRVLNVQVTQQSQHWPGTDLQIGNIF